MCPRPQIDTSETELPEEKATERSYSQTDEDAFQASERSLRGRVCSADQDYLNSSTPKVPIGRKHRPLTARHGWGIC